MNSKAGFRSFPKFKLACLGGTFDHFHKGHQAFLEKGFEAAQKVVIGLTSERFTKKKILSEAILSFKKRKKELKAFLKQKRFLKRTEIIKIEGPFTPRILDPEIECLVVSEKTKKNAKPLNQKRIENNLTPLEVMVVSIIVNKNGECISSEKIRLGKMDRNGEVFVNEFFFEKTFVLPQELRHSLKEPLDELISGSEKNLQKAALEFKQRLKHDFCSFCHPELDSGSQVMKIPKRVRNDKKGKTPVKLLPTMLIAVGDIVTLSLVKEGIIPNLSIVDFKVDRKEIYQDITQLGFSSNIRVKETINEHGTLNPELFKAIKNSIKNFLRLSSYSSSEEEHSDDESRSPSTVRQSSPRAGSGYSSRQARTITKCVNPASIIKVSGEEDLAVLPAVLLAPLNSLVLYGQPRKGIVVIKVTEKKKKEIKKVICQFQEKEKE